ncbi:organic cation transporter protein-like [Aricia agestis]|uniref:organic cation transporter protein-like n=1 Tax=Aricia agestis TaxID=91739 RepID=UPI001C20758E|nr:organic cation transporter protein-like [Aricia agestis]
MCKEVNKDIHPHKTIDIAGILEKFGQYQMWQYFLICLPTIFVSMTNVNYVFVAGEVNHRCRVPECESTNPVFSPNWWPDSAIGSCDKPILNLTSLENDSVCTNTSFTASLEKCTDLLYENNDTIVAEFNLGCEPFKVSFVGTIRGIGSIIAVVVAGWMSDRFGRKPTIILGAVACVLGNLKVLARYEVYLFIEFLEAAIALAVYTAGPVLMSESSTSKTRTLAGVLFAYSVYMGEALLACAAMGLPYWKHLLHVICSPPLLFISYILIMDESLRWQIITGRLDKARITLQRIMQINKFEYENGKVENITDDEIRKALNVNEGEKKEGTKDIFKSKLIVIRLVAGTIWRLSVSFIYYTLVVNSVYLPGNKYTNFLLSALTSFPGELFSMYLMNKFGRRKPLMAGFLVCGATCIASSYVPNDLTWLKILLFLIGKLLASASFTASVVYTLELFPTSVRGFCSGICTLAACVGTMLAPLTPALSAVSPILTSFCIGLLSVVSFTLLFTTPETHGKALSNTIEEITAESRKEANSP